ncbi:MAG: hypothetical protein HUJ98_04965 [Bacteroidaceae bacterium]|nr:hypothetical protein [Bacteroidaceae bacterium]
MFRNKKILLAVAAVIVVAVVAAGIMIFKPAADNSNPKAHKEGKGDFVIACVGDSITYGRGIDDREKYAYPTVLQHLLGPETTTWNFGYSARCAGFETDYPYVNEDYYDQCLELEADLYILMLGTNDTKPYNWDRAGYKEGLTKIAQSFADTGAKVVLMKSPACFVLEGKDSVGFNIDGDMVATEVQDVIGEVAEELELPCIDLFKATKEHPEWFYDGVHPDADGAAKIAEIIYEYLIGNIL